MAMTTLPTGIALSAFRSIPSQLLNERDSYNDPPRGLVPVNSNLIPAPLVQAFSIPVVAFNADPAEGYCSNIPPAFRLPLPFVGNSMDAKREISSAGRAGEMPRSRVKERESYESYPVTLKHQVTEEGQIPAKSVGEEAVPMSSILTAQAQACLESAKPVHKPRVVWTEELHQRFLRAINAAGSDEAAVPTVILKLMNVSGLSRDNVASHLQKHRLGLKRGKSRKRKVPATKAPKGKLNKVASGSGVQLADEDIDELGMPVEDGCDAMRRSPGAEPPAAGSGQASKGDKSGTEEGEGQGCAGSNDRDDCDGLHDVPSSDDGAGAGSDNRNSACPAESPQKDSCMPDSLKAGASGIHSGSPSLAVPENQLGHPVDAAVQQQGFSGPTAIHSRSASYNPSKQQGNSNAISCLPGSARTPGSVPWTVGNESLTSISKSLQGSGSRNLSTVNPVGVAMALPMPPQVPAANAERMRAPRLGENVQLPKT